MNFSTEYSTVAIIGALEKFKEKHVEEYLLAEKEFLHQLAMKAESLLTRIKNNEKIDSKDYVFNLVQPILSADEYDKKITVFKTALDAGQNKITLSFRDADEIFNDTDSKFDMAKMVNNSYAMSRH